MLQELTTQTGAGGWATASTLFFIAVYVIVSIRLFRQSSASLDQQARLALDDDEPRDREGQPS
jgi:hypothetical protein